MQGSGLLVWGWGVGILVSLLTFRVACSGFRVKGFVFRVYSGYFSLWGLGLGFAGSGFHVLVVGVRVSCNGIQDSGLGVRVRVKDSRLVVYV